jgi:hypothetical protein
MKMTLSHSEAGTDDKILEAWDALNGAIQRMLVSQPYQMTDAAARLEDARQKFNSLLWQSAYQKKSGSV